MPQNFPGNLRKLLFQKAHRPCRLPAGLLLGNRGRERAFIHLHILVQGNPVNLHYGGGHHIGRLFLHDKIPEFLDINGSLRHQIRGDGFSSRSRLVSGNRHVAYPREPADDGLHLGEFNPKSPDFHLSVSPAHKLNVAVRQKPHVVSGVVNALIPFPVSKAIGGINLRHLLRPVQIPFAYLITGHAQFPHGPRRKPAHLLIHHIHFQIVQRPSDGHVIVFPCFVHRVNRRQYRAFRGAVAVIKIKTGFHPDRHQRLPACQQVFQTVILHLQSKLPPHLRSHKRMRHLLLYQIFVQLLQFQTHFLRYDTQGSAACKNRIGIHHIRIESITGVGADHAVLSHPVIAAVPVAKGRQISMGEHTAFGRAGSPGGIQKDIGILRQRGGNLLCPLRRKTRNLFCRQHLSVVLGNQLQQCFIRNQQFCLRVLHHKGQPLRRILGVQRLVDCSRLHHAQGGNGHIFPAENQNRDRLVLSNPQTADISGHAVGEPVDFPVGKPLLPENHRRMLRRLFCLTAKQFQQGESSVIVRALPVIRIQNRHIFRGNKGNILKAGAVPESLQRLHHQRQQRARRPLQINVASVFQMDFITAVFLKHMNRQIRQTVPCFQCFHGNQPPLCVHAV